MLPFGAASHISRASLRDRLRGEIDQLNNEHVKTPVCMNENDATTNAERRSKVCIEHSGRREEAPHDPCLITTHMDHEKNNLR